MVSYGSSLWFRIMVKSGAKGKQFGKPLIYGESDQLQFGYNRQQRLHQLVDGHWPLESTTMWVDPDKGFELVEYEAGFRNEVGTIVEF